MSSLRGIPITVVGAAAPEHACGANGEERPIIVEPGMVPLEIMENGIVLALLCDIEALLETLASSGQPGVIDLRRQPLGPEEYEKLKEVLGRGEVAATVNTLGAVHVWETEVPGVWWLSYRNDRDETLTEAIEVTDFPEILRTDPADIRVAAERLRLRRASLESEAKSRQQGGYTDGYTDKRTGNGTGVS